MHDCISKPGVVADGNELAITVQSSHLDANGKSAPLRLVDPYQIPARRRLVLIGLGSRPRTDTHDGNTHPGQGNHIAVIVPVQNEFGTGTLQNFSQPVCIGKRPPGRRLPR